MGINYLVTMIFARPNITNIIITSFILFKTRHNLKKIVNQTIELSKKKLHRTLHSNLSIHKFPNVVEKFIKQTF
jgi:hypothetical protein